MKITNTNNINNTNKTNNTNNTNKNTAITETMVVKSAAFLAYLASVCTMILGFFTANLRMSGISALFVCFLTGFWVCRTLNDRKEKEAEGLFA